MVIDSDVNASELCCSVVLHYSSGKKHSAFLYTQSNCLPGGVQWGVCQRYTQQGADMREQKQLHVLLHCLSRVSTSALVFLCRGCLPANHHLPAPSWRTSEDDLSKLMKVMNKNPNLFYNTQPHTAISHRLTVNTAAPDLQSMEWQCKDASDRLWLTFLCILCNRFACHSHWLLLRRWISLMHQILCEYCDACQTLSRVSVNVIALS